jgi:hypothetical protein
MLIGYNTNVRYKGKVYHVQTEDSGLGRNTLITLLYYEGAILHSKKSSYADLIGNPDFEGRLREMMKEQHKEVLKGLIAGKFETGQSGSEQEASLRPEGAGDQIMEPQEAETKGEPPIVAEEPQITRRRRKSLDDILLEHISRKVKDR